MAEHYKREKIFSFVHFSSGQELAPVAISLKLLDTDRVFGNHRSHAHYLARGGSLVAMFSEMLGSRAGASRGYGGSMHLIDKNAGFWGSSPVLGSIAPIAAGSSFEQSLKPDRDDLTVVFIGDGASEEGIVAETLNLVALWNLPLLFVIEDNLYAVNSPAAKRRPEKFKHKKLAEAYGIEFFLAPRIKILEHIEACQEAVTYVRSERKPAVLLAESFRNFAHSSPLTDDHLNYRELDVEPVRKRNDHLSQLRSALVNRNVEDRLLEEFEEVTKTAVRHQLDIASFDAGQTNKD